MSLNREERKITNGNLTEHACTRTDPDADDQHHDSMLVREIYLSSTRTRPMDAD